MTLERPVADNAEVGYQYLKEEAERVKNDVDDIEARDLLPPIDDGKNSLMLPDWLFEFVGTKILRIADLLRTAEDTFKRDGDFRTKLVFLIDTMERLVEEE